jgi:hypothetical protein
MGRLPGESGKPFGEAVYGKRLIGESILLRKKTMNKKGKERFFARGGADGKGGT